MKGYISDGLVSRHPHDYSECIPLAFPVDNFGMSSVSIPTIECNCCVPGIVLIDRPGRSIYALGSNINHLSPLVTALSFPVKCTLLKILLTECVKLFSITNIGLLVFHGPCDARFKHPSFAITSTFHAWTHISLSVW